MDVGRLRISDGWSGVFGRLFQTESVMGRLWDDHFRQLGHPPKFYRVQDASSGNNSPFWYHFRVNLMKNHWKITKNHVFSKKWLSKKKKAPARMLVTVVRSGDAPKPAFSSKSIEKKKSGNQPLNRQKTKPYFLVCIARQVDNWPFLNRHYREADITGNRHYREADK